MNHMMDEKVFKKHILTVFIYNKPS